MIQIRATLLLSTLPLWLSQCALANNCFRCYDLTDTFMEAMARQLAAFEAAGDDLDLDDLGGGGALTTSATGRLDRRMVAAEVDRIKEGFAKVSIRDTAVAFTLPAPAKLLT